MKAGVIGSGAVAQVLAAGLLKHGKAEAARAIEPLCILWCIPGFLRNEWTHAFKLLHASGERK